MENLMRIAEEIRTELDAKNEARDEALITCREAIRFCANSIRSIHRGELEEAARLLNEARVRVRETANELKEHPDLYYTGYVQDAQKEFAEAEVMHAIIQRRRIPSHRELEIEVAPYLNGFAEAISECRRAILDLLRSGNMTKAEELLKVMDDAYYMLVSLDYPDAITGGLRRTMDTVRAVLERTRGDLTVTLRQSELEKVMREAIQKFEKTSGT